MQMLTPLEEHVLLLFWLQLLVLFVAARGLGLLARRVGQPPVVGELLAGLLIGPSLLGRLLPGPAQWLFPGDELTSGPVLAVAWVGVILLLIETGFETDLGLLRRIGRSTAMVPLGSLVLPLGMGIGLGFLMPDTFLAQDGGRTLFALFIGVCLAVSSLPVVAKALIEMGLMRRNVGQVILAAGMADDIVGWVMLSVLAGVATSGQFEPAVLGMTVAAIAGFLLFAFTVGQRLTNGLLRWSLRGADGSLVAPLTAILAVVLAFAALTQAIGIEAVFGAFVAGIVIGRSRFFRPRFHEVVHSVGHGFLAPIFFATAGMYVDVWQLTSPTVLVWTAIVIAVASFSKLVGSYVGARLGPLGHGEAVAVGFGLNARGALEVIIATIAFSLGVFNQQTYSVIVLLALATSVAAPPFLRWALRRTQMTPQEAERLAREELLASSVIADARNVLLPTRGGANSALAARVLDQVLQPGAHLTLMTVVDDDSDEPAQHAAADELRRAVGRVETELRVVRHPEAPAAILDEARLGYDLVALGLNEDVTSGHRLSERLRAVVSASPAPLILVRRAGAGPGEGELAFRRILVPVSGTRTSRAAEEIAYTLGARLHTDVDAVHVVDRPDVDGEPHPGTRQLTRSRDLAGRIGGGMSALLRSGASPHEEIVAAVRERDADLVVLGAQPRTHEGEAFLGYGTEYVLEHVAATVIVVAFPDAHGHEAAGEDRR